MSKRMLLILMVLFSFLTTTALYGSEDNKAESKRQAAIEEAFMKKLDGVRYPAELDFKGTSLSDALSIISRTSGVTIVAAAPVADKKIDLYLPRDDKKTLKRVIDTIKSTNGLTSKVLNDTLILSSDILPAGAGISIPNGKVVGKVTEIDKLNGIKGVTMSLSDDSSTLVLSDVGGAFIIDEVKPGTYILKATRKGYLPSGDIVEVKPGETTNINVVLSKQERIQPLTAKDKKIGKVVKSNGEISDTKMIELLYSSPNEVKDVVKEIVTLDNIVVDEKINTLILVGTEENIKTATNLIEQLDTPQKQVRVKARIYDLTSKLAKTVGVDWSARTQDGDYTFDGGAMFSAEKGMDLIFGDFVNNTLQFTLSMLESTGDVDIQAEPSVVTLNGEVADLKVVTEEIVGFEKETEDDGSSSEKPLFKEAGIILQVRPIIKSDETIIMEVYAKLSKFVKEGSYDSAGEIKSELKTIVRVKSGESVVIGGLKRVDVDTGISKVPVLGNIPLLKYFFSSKTDTHSQRDLFIEVTPEILLIDKFMGETAADEGYLELQ
ncbi:MAG: type II secretion system protein GspD [Fusobacteria bacterium]|nr:type II secretion system protein GspD [Fusobacteriota bacterium]